MFTEEGIRLSEEICRNVLLFFLKAQRISKFTIDSNMLLLSIFQSNSDNLSQLLAERHTLSVKLADINQVALDEVNEVRCSIDKKISRCVNSVIFAGLSLKQRQTMYLKKMSESLLYTSQKIEILMSMDVKILTTLDISEFCVLILSDNATSSILSKSVELVEQFLKSPSVREFT
jgi:hypothetical protein